MLVLSNSTDRRTPVRRTASCTPRPPTSQTPAFLTTRMLADDTGSATAEYAIATLAAVGFAGLLVVILRSDEVRGMLTDLIHHALSIAG
jgi:Protein of unknown function (DUF4244)